METNMVTQIETRDSHHSHHIYIFEAISRTQSAFTSNQLQYIRILLLLYTILLQRTRHPIYRATRPARTHA
jgi:hypothetical protein